MRITHIDYIPVFIPWQKSFQEPMRAWRAAAVAEAAGVPIWLQIEGHCYDIQAAYNVHLNAVIPNATLPQDTLPFLREESIVTEPLWPTDGFVSVPEKPGLGIELNDEAIDCYRVA